MLVKNLSQINDVTLIFTPTTNLGGKVPIQFPLPAGATEDITGLVNSTVNMYVKIKDKIIWMGVIPVVNGNPIVISPDEKKVSYMDMEIPNGFEGYEPRKKNVGDFKMKWVLLLLLLIFLISGVIFLRK